ncbi:uncharacterized protein [Clytia hemisphaerica]|uniref:uncharacterized protein n=1 Tax=Clytia hemisphaerica TaxID=252671 RepID=UPI0034D3D36F
MPDKNPINFDDRFEGLEKDPVFLRKRKATLICFFIRMFLLGAEYAIILPSIWLYLKRYPDVKTWFLGIVVAIYPTSAVLSLPVVGRIFDKTKRSKELIIVLNTFEIVGNIIYALPFSKWLIFAGRFFAGLGDGFYACATSEIVHTYPLSSRTGALALLELGRVLGLTFGPALNFFLVKVDFTMGKWTIDNGTAPGLFMAILWLLAQLISVFYISNLSLLIEERAKYQPNMQLDRRGNVPPTEYEIDFKRVRETSLCESVLDVTYGDEKPLVPKEYRKHFKCYKAANGRTFIDDNIVTEDDEEFYNDDESQMTTTDYGDSIKLVQKKSAFQQALELITTIEIVAIFYSDLILSLIQTEFEVFLPLITQEGYGWKETETSGVYMVGGVWLMFVFFLMYKFSGKSKIKDQHYIIISLILTSLALLLLMVEVVVPKHARVAVFVIICVFVFSAIPLNLVAGKSLTTKLTPRETQGFTQAVYSSISRVSLILGPIIAAAAFEHRLQFSASMLCFCIVGLIAMVMLLGKIRRKIIKIQG